MNPPLQVHLTAIGGIGMTALAGLLVALGHRVRGSDLDVYPPASDELRALGVPVARGYRAENLEPRPDLVVIGNAISATNPEAVAARRAALPTLSLPEALVHFCLRGRAPLVIAGTHGKTTSASFLAWLLVCAGRAPGYFIGGAPRDLEAGYALGAGPEFVLEGDEYDTAYFDKGPKFLHYRPEGVVLTAVEFDHADIYRDLAHVQASFGRLLALLPEGAPVLVCADFPAALEVVRKSGRPHWTFASGEAVRADWRIEELRDSPEGLRFFAAGPGERHELRTPLLGVMNARNLLGVAALARGRGVPWDAIAMAAATFHGVRRRQELIVEGERVLIDDFAHHPTAIRATLQAVRSRYPERRLWALFDPRSNTSRRRVFQAEIAEALAGADHVLIGPVHRSEQLEPAERFSPDEACQAIEDAGRTAYASRDYDEVFTRVAAEARPGDVVVVLSNGPFGGLAARLRDAWREPSRPI